MAKLLELKNPSVKVDNWINIFAHVIDALQENPLPVESWIFQNIKMNENPFLFYILVNAVRGKGDDIKVAMDLFSNASPRDKSHEVFPFKLSALFLECIYKHRVNNSDEFISMARDRGLI